MRFGVDGACLQTAIKEWKPLQAECGAHSSTKAGLEGDEEALGRPNGLHHRHGNTHTGAYFLKTSHSAVQDHMRCLLGRMQLNA